MLVEKTKMTNENPTNARENNPLGNAISVMIFVAAVVFGGWYAYNQSVKVADTPAPAASTAANTSSGTTTP
jgi:hypothetical protein